MTPWTPEAIEASRELDAELMGQIPLGGISETDFWRPAREDGGDFVLWGKSHKDRPRRRYVMVYTPEGFAVHQGEGCEGEPFNGPLGCWHSKEYSSMTNNGNALAVRPDLVPQLIEFTDAQLKTIADVICVDSDGHTAPPAFVELFVGACRASGLNPFLKQIYALKVKGKWQLYVGIDGYRVISERTGLDQGMDGPQWSDDGVTWLDYPMGPDPKFCRVGIWRKGVPRAFFATIAMAAYRQSTGRWVDDAPGMLAKSAEALARRRAFPANTAVIPKSAILEEPSEDAFPDAIDGSFWEVQAQRADEAAVIHGEGVSPDDDGQRETAERQLAEGLTTSQKSAASPAPPHGDTQEAEAQPLTAVATGAPSAPPAPPPTAVQAPPRPAPPALPRPAPMPPAPGPEPGPVTPSQDALNVWWAATRQANLDRHDVIEKCKAMFGVNKEPKDVAPEQRALLLHALLEGQEQKALI